MGISLAGSNPARSEFLSEGTIISVNSSCGAFIIIRARLAQSVEHQTFNLRVKGSSPLLGASFFFIKCYDACTITNTENSMDPLSQGLVGATASQSLSNRKDIVTATVLGFLSGMAADLDIFIRSSEDPLLFLEFHRQFTHSLIFMPIGGLICACVFWLLLHFVFNKTNLSFIKIYLFITV